MALPVPDPRSKTRHHMEPDVRLTLAEGDLDHLEGSLARAKLESADHYRKLNGKLDRMLWILVGGLVSFTTAALLLAINIAANNGL